MARLIIKIFKMVAIIIVVIDISLQVYQIPKLGQINYTAVKKYTYLITSYAEPPMLEYYKYNGFIIIYA